MSIISFCNPSFATDPDISASTTSLSCDDSALNDDNGPVNIEVNWEPNEINLHWYDNNTLIENVASESTSCTYDDGLMPPTPPTKTGYTFRGWRSRPTYDFSTIPTSTQGAGHWGRGYSGGVDYCYYNSGTSSATTVECSSDNTFAQLSPYEWKVNFPWGEIYGSAKCSAKSGDNYGTWPTANISDWLATYNELETAGSGTNCWCRVTGYKPSDSNTLYRPASVSVPSVWVYFTDTGLCLQKCASLCAQRCSNKYVFRRALLRDAQ